MSFADAMARKGKNVDPQKIAARLASTARDLGLAFTEQIMVSNTRKAQELGLWAQSQGKGHAFHNAAYRAYFADALNLHDTGVLMNLIQEAGLDPGEATNVLETSSFAQAVDRDWDLAKKMEVRVIPTFIMGDKRLAGAQTYGALKKLVASQ